MKQPIDPTGVARRRVERLGPDAGETLDAVVVEEPLEIRVDGDTIGVTMRTPGDDDRLALGFLFGEGIVQSRADVSSVAHCGRPGEEGYRNTIEVRSGPGASLDADRILEGRRFIPTTSACGVCGRQTIEDLLSRCGVLVGGDVLSRHLVFACLDEMRRLQPRFDRTGGLHAAAAFDAKGAALACFEDVGRHNAVDKVVGQLLRDARVGEDARERPPALLVVSGRAGFEIVQKAAMARIPVVVSVSAPTSLSIDLAARAGITLAGFARGESMNVYTHPWRIEADDSGPRLRAIPGEGRKNPAEGGGSLASGKPDEAQAPDPVESIASRYGVPVLRPEVQAPRADGAEAPLWFDAPRAPDDPAPVDARFGSPVLPLPGTAAGGSTGDDALSRLARTAAEARARREARSVGAAVAEARPASAREIPVPFAHVVPDATRGAIVVTAQEQAQAEARRRGPAAELIERTDRMLRSARTCETEVPTADSLDELEQRWRDVLAAASAPASPQAEEVPEEPAPEPSWSTLGQDGAEASPRTVLIDDRDPVHPAPVLWPRGSASGGS